MKTNLETIEVELKKCREEWAANPDAKFAWCCHHAVLIESLTEPAENRIQYILDEKPEYERAARFRNFRPVRVELPVKFDKACAEYKKSRTEYKKACVEWNKACVAELDKAYAEYRKADAEFGKAEAELDKARVECKEELTTLHNQDWSDNTWNGKDVFGRS